MESTPALRLGGHLCCKLNFSQISGIFATCFDCFLPANTTNTKSLNYRNFTLPFLRNIQTLETCNLRDRDEAWNLRAGLRLARMELNTGLEEQWAWTGSGLYILQDTCDFFWSGLD